MNPVIVIPTFVSPRRRKDSGSVIATYDHTTPLSNPGELPRLLTSLQKVRGIGQIIVLVAAEPAISDQAAEKVQDIVSRFPSLNIAIIGADECNLVQQRMEQLGLGKLSKEIGLTGYGAIRNLGLVLANVMGFDSIVFLDDDEVIDDADFLQKGVYGLGKLTRKGVPILAKTGYYLNSEGSYLSKSQDKWYNHFWQQGKAFNKWITKAMRGPRLSRSNHVCGGCLAIHKEAFKRLSFDPWVARGEDLDYMLNLRMYGSDIWFDNQWSLRHLPPASTSEGMRFRQDIYRWLYEYRKMEYSRTQIDLMQVKPQSLNPIRVRSWSRASRSASASRPSCAALPARTRRRTARPPRPRALRPSCTRSATARSTSSSSSCGPSSWPVWTATRSCTRLSCSPWRAARRRRTWRRRSPWREPALASIRA